MIKLEEYKKMQLKKAKKGFYIWWIKKLFGRIKSSNSFSIPYYFGQPGPQINRFIKRVYKKKNLNSRRFTRRGFNY